MVQSGNTHRGWPQRPRCARCKREGEAHHPRPQRGSSPPDLWLCARCRMHLGLDVDPACREIEERMAVVEFLHACGVKRD